MAGYVRGTSALKKEDLFCFRDDSTFPMVGGGEASAAPVWSGASPSCSLTGAGGWKRKDGCFSHCRCSCLLIQP